MRCRRSGSVYHRLGVAGTDDDTAEIDAVISTCAGSESTWTHAADRCGEQQRWMTVMQAERGRPRWQQRDGASTSYLLPTPAAHNIQA